ncbi:Hypothetical Protein FCC1311_064572 [Hondaea fermentalgiana]|uniref:Uncharacterized protein n=1 Tax=Hondaea fermentalgiana TaxID=2315210 RepID=A0A2R5GH69_9STRA|nr:Hypothetical Protein FCC1311_064572 [Hondaea fermentalgiana]|eukprot:GBG30237.1 Hypothetical Protein FCC1311_064572 [Hondaea fermentalgiana]
MCHPWSDSVATLHMLKRFVATSRADAGAVFAQAALVVVRGAVSPVEVNEVDLEDTWHGLDAASQATWCVENGQVPGQNEALRQANQELVTVSSPSWYASFIAKTVPKGLPLVGVPFAKSHSDSIWFFAGCHQPSDGQPLRGRREHTDDVPHDGTFHIQVSGTKHWFLRPTDELVQRQGSGLRADDKFAIVCGPGDLIAVNTRLWWHETALPAALQPSVSYARDFYLQEDARAQEADFVNQDGFYAAAAISAGTIIVREQDMPDCELPTSKGSRANAQVVELEDEDGNGSGMALVASRDIATGEWFVVYDSDAESDAADE